MSSAFQVSDELEGTCSPVKGYQYELEVDEKQNNKASELRVFHGSRPHMRAFQCAWWSLFVAFFVWFTIMPLMPDIQKTLQLTEKQVWNSTIISGGGAVLIRLILGPLCDMYGARTPFAVLLCLVSIPTAMIGLVNSVNGLYIVRCFIGMAGGAFVMSQHWTTSMFTLEIVGTANGVAAGWGNLGATVTQLLIGTMLLPLFKILFESGDRTDEKAAELAWRSVSIIPAIVALLTGIVMYYVSDDSPKGNYSDLKKKELMSEVSFLGSFSEAARNPATWIMAIQYACCFGVELTMNTVAVMYFRREFSQPVEVAAAIAAIFGWMNLFARGLGGHLSDMAMAHMGMRGRISVHSLFLFGEGVLVFIFANTKGLAASIVVMMIFSIFVQAAEGTSFGIVPYICPTATGSVTGIVGAGGSVGAILFGLAFREYGFDQSFVIMGAAVLCSTFLSAFLFISKDHSSLFFPARRPGSPEFSRGNVVANNNPL